ncbi:hypothetical protein [Pseudomonas fluorescens]|uniref:Uncharacterized protein n=1 Tax=Pseudomonas fluorescens TaxID=294 RepID=A0A0F4V3G1_PSEFL|nr:hypothetical protein [Pseudomonas fluorescens]KJZ63045.1 hypothetical protein VD17_25395 [Pseudomonas fluorescens]
MSNFDKVDLSFETLEQIFKFLSLDKHTIAEGMVFEDIFDQVMGRVSRYLDREVVTLNIETFVAKDSGDKLVAFVWDRGAEVGLRRYLRALAIKCEVYVVVWDSSENIFYAKPYPSVAKEDKYAPLIDIVSKIGSASLREHKVNDSVRDQARQLGAFYGHLSNVHAGRTKERVALTRYLVNCIIQPWFSGVWNIDRVLLVDEKIIILEAKHKYPFGKGEWSGFGLNDGEAALIGELIDCGMRVLHTIIVKPYWNKNIGSAYLLSNLNARDNAHVLGVELSRLYIDKVLKRKSRAAPAETSINGNSKVYYKTLYVDEFFRCQYCQMSKEWRRKLLRL